MKLFLPQLLQAAIFVCAASFFASTSRAQAPQTAAILIRSNAEAASVPQMVREITLALATRHWLVLSPEDVQSTLGGAAVFCDEVACAESLWTSLHASLLVSLHAQQNDEGIVTISVTLLQESPRRNSSSARSYDSSDDQKSAGGEAQQAFAEAFDTLMSTPDAREFARANQDMRWANWTLGGALIAGGVGLAILGINNVSQRGRCLEQSALGCVADQQFEPSPEFTLGLGIGLASVGVIVWIIEPFGSGPSDPQSLQAQLSIDGNGLSLRGSF